MKTLVVSSILLIRPFLDFRVELDLSRFGTNYLSQLTNYRDFGISEVLDK